MDQIRILGGKRLSGTIHISGAKNAALPLMAASLLTAETIRLANLPHLADISTMTDLLAQLGVEIRMDGLAGNGGHAGRVLSLRAGAIAGTTAPYDLVRTMRASVLVLGPLLARAGRARVSLPGGCAIGNRPVDLHLWALSELGAEIELADGYIDARAPKGLRGADIVFPQVSVGATENAMMAAALAEGETVLANAAREPEIVDLANCLVKMGAEIEGIGTGVLTIRGVGSLGGAEHAIVPDRIETGTYAMAAAITGGDIELKDTRCDLLDGVLDKLRETGLSITPTDTGFRASRAGDNRPLSAVDVETAPFPGFPTDLQAQMMALMSVAPGASVITETVFEDRFMHVLELARMGADITVDGASARVLGVDKLIGAEVMATDLRASVSLVLAGLAAEGETVINRVYHLDRGYERLEEKLSACGAEIERIKDGQ